MFSHVFLVGDLETPVTLLVVLSTALHLLHSTVVSNDFKL